MIYSQDELDEIRATTDNGTVLHWLDQVEQLRTQLERYRKVLETYTDKYNWDNGKRAREALEGK